MSIHAISWALSQDMARSSEKFILVCLANYADESGVCYPSIARMCRDTSQDRKTVINNLKSLCESGLLRDTQRRVGPTGGVPVYKIIGLPDASKHHYVYKLIRQDTGQYYIGKRSCEGDPEADTYRGSGRWPREMANAGVLMIREIISQHTTSTEALAEEMRIMRSLQDDPLLMNLETPKRKRQNGLEQFQKRNSSNFSDEVSQNSAQEVPFFLGSGPENGTQNRHRTVKESSVTHTEALPDWIPEETWKGFEEMRQKIRKPLTDRAKKMIFAKLDEFRKDGHEPKDVLEQSIVSAWSGVFPLKKMAEAKTVKEAPWWSSNEAMLKKGRELGLQPRSGESWQDFRGRIDRKLGGAA